MGLSSRYWNIWRISPAGDRPGYQSCVVPPAQEFFVKTFQCPAEQPDVSGAQNTNYHTELMPHFQESGLDAIARAKAGLCLRCYVSDSILNACRKIDNLFGGQNCFTYHDLLPFALNDDGETLMLLGDDNKTQLVLDESGKTRATEYKFFSLEILQTFKLDPSNALSLKNWVYLQTQQNKEIKSFLAEFGFKNLTDWALLNRAKQAQLDRLSERDRHLIEAFHCVYRRDRRSKKTTTKCADPSSDQLQEMLTHLSKHSVTIDSPAQLLTALRRIADQLRQYDIWSSREPLELYDPDNSDYTLRNDLPHESYDAVKLEQQELLTFFEKCLKTGLSKAIEKGVGDRITALEKSSKYAPFAPQFTLGLQQYYEKGLSLKEIAPELGMTSWDQARRVLNPGELLNTIRTLTLEQVLDCVLEKAHKMGLTTMPPEPEYLQTLMVQIEAFTDAEIFQEAAEEIRAGKNRSMQSAYAHSLRLFLLQSLQPAISLEVYHV
jgi:hypothetical protein